jgi:glycosyltransferase involved in cell wall biosynthesis
MSKSLVSIVIPVYNGANYLKEAIDSALAQTYENVEVIVVNDGSTDGGKTESVAKSYGDRIRYFYKENGGVSTALNLGIRNMKGTWFAWLSHDDLFSENRIEEDMATAKANPDAKVIFCRRSKINERGEVIQRVEYRMQRVTNAREALSGVHMCVVTIHRSCFDRVGLFNESNRTTQDTEMLLRLSCLYPFILNSRSVTYTREHPNRGVHTQADQHQKDRLALCDFIHENLSLQNFFPDSGDGGDATAQAWILMGHMYRNFGAPHYANECYASAVRAQRSHIKRLQTFYYLKTLQIKRTLRAILS